MTTSEVGRIYGHAPGQPDGKLLAAFRRAMKGPGAAAGRSYCRWAGARGVTIGRECDGRAVLRAVARRHNAVPLGWAVALDAEGAPHRVAVLTFVFDDVASSAENGLLLAATSPEDEHAKKRRPTDDHPPHGLQANGSTSSCAARYRILTSAGPRPNTLCRVRYKSRSVLALLFIAPVLTAGCGGTSSPPSEQHASTSPSEQHAPLTNGQDALVKLAKLHGRAYVEASKNLPDQIETR